MAEQGVVLVKLLQALTLLYDEKALVGKNNLCIRTQNLASHKGTCGSGCMLTHQPEQKNSTCPL